MGSESAGFEQAAGDVVGEVAEAEGGAAEVFEAAVDRLGRAVGGAGSVEEREDVDGALFQGASEASDLDERGGTPLLTASMTACIICLPSFLSGSRYAATMR